jgi:alpha-D-ribose 1-methylphosphonate 5-phosphate C-P lyase
MNSMTRYERIIFFKKNMCAICHSKYCKHDIHVTNDNGVTTTVCYEYNKTRKDQLISEKSNSL